MAQINNILLTKKNSKKSEEAEKILKNCEIKFEILNTNEGDAPVLILFDKTGSHYDGLSAIKKFAENYRQAL
jgi:hypothetical protein